MATAVQKIKLSPSRDIPFNKLVLSQSNVRRVKAGVSIEQLAESIALRTLLQSLSVRAVVDADGQETGMFEVPAGGRRYRALELLVKQKRMAKTQPVPCVVRDDGIAEDDSLAENDERIGLHPLDQFRAFQALYDGGMSEEDIAARHFVTPAIVKQRLRLASVSAKLHDVYAEDGMTLEQLMAFAVTPDQARQEQVWDNVSRSQLDDPYQIRRMLTENTVRASDRRAQFIGLEAYEKVGGAVPAVLLEVGRSLCLGRLRTIISIVLPAAAPGLFTAARLAAAYALVVAVTVEIFANPQGLGYALIVSQQMLHPETMLAMLFWVGVIGWGMNSIFLQFQRTFLVRWSDVEQRQT
jgi:ParB family chromosome partitioning protein